VSPTFDGIGIGKRFALGGGKLARRVFISYRRDDQPDAAARIRDGLAVRFGPRHVFIDIESLLPGGQFDEGLANALDRSDILLVIIGSRWEELIASRTAGGETDFVRKEIAGALERKLSIIPVRVGDQGQLPPLPRAESLPEDIRELVRYQTQDVTYQSMGRDITSLADAIVRLRQEEARKKSAAGSSIAHHTVLLGLVFVVIGILAASASQLDIAKGLSSLLNLGGLGWFFGYLASPNFSNWDALLAGMGRTLAIALWGVTLAGVISLPLALASSGNLSSTWIAWPLRRLTRVVETIEVALVGALFLLLFGLSPFTAVLAICVHNTGALSRLFSEAIETADRPIANVRYASASGRQVMYAVLPEVLPQWVAGMATRFSSAVRAALVLDMLGMGGGIGQQLMNMMHRFDLPQLAVAVPVTVIALIMVDMMTRLIGRLLGQ
jgi:phosphonate transport system permease protein